ncbi:hypothetical protein NC651_018471 [Populus alba x Populus x berolinensis]|nr:hypothetical protein NC651_018471 [Populus alba x Populus x berolinensis]
MSHVYRTLSVTSSCLGEDESLRAAPFRLKGNELAQGGRPSGSLCLEKTEGVKVAAGRGGIRENGEPKRGWKGGLCPTAEEKENQKGGALCYWLKEEKKIGEWCGGS